MGRVFRVVQRIGMILADESGMSSELKRTIPAMAMLAVLCAILIIFWRW
jgi:hypothetical protein